MEQSHGNRPSLEYIQQPHTLNMQQPALTYEQQSNQITPRQDDYVMSTQQPIQNIQSAVYRPALTYNQPSSQSIQVDDLEYRRPLVIEIVCVYSLYRPYKVQWL